MQLTYTKQLQKIEVDSSLTLSQIIKKYNLPKTTAWRAKKNGFFLRDYGKKKKDGTTKKERHGDYIFAKNPEYYFFIFNFRYEDERKRDYFLDYFTSRKFDLKNPIAYAIWLIKNREKDFRKY